MSITEGLDETYSDYEVRVEYALTTDDISLTDRTYILSYDSSNYINIEYYST